MTKKQFIIISIISAILTGDFMYLIIYFPNELFEFLFWAVSTAFCFVFFLPDRTTHMDKRRYITRPIPYYLYVRPRY